MKKVFITGGSGTVGESFIRNFYNKYKFYSYSRNEKAQVALKRKFPKIEIILGSIEDRLSLENAVFKSNPDIIIHSAALKHVDTAEKQPIEMVKSNIIGSNNIIEVSKKAAIAVTVGISTDKACNPKNLYGFSKLLMEKMFLEANNNETKFCCTRFGNVVGSNGSVIPYWLRNHNSKGFIPLTSKEMRRLMITSDEASVLIEKAINDTVKSGGGFVLSKKMKAVKLYDLAKLISNNIKIIGLRGGEELDEDLVSMNELEYTITEEDFIKIYSHKNDEKKKQLHSPISSKNSIFMDEFEMAKLIEIVKSKISKEEVY
jgi:UDP-N-acetylglucosamine 4,6-dehydratase